MHDWSKVSGTLPQRFSVVTASTRCASCQIRYMTRLRRLQRLANDAPDLQSTVPLPILATNWSPHGQLISSMPGKSFIHDRLRVRGTLPTSRRRESFAPDLTGLNCHLPAPRGVSIRPLLFSVEIPHPLTGPCQQFDVEGKAVINSPPPLYATPQCLCNGVALLGSL